MEIFFRMAEFLQVVKGMVLGPVEGSREVTRGRPLRQNLDACRKAENSEDAFEGENERRKFGGKPDGRAHRTGGGSDPLRTPAQGVMCGIEQPKPRQIPASAMELCPHRLELREPIAIGSCQEGEIDACVFEVRPQF